jgi:acyl-CoA synthetase (AMP-forming)/AMP-acid ligase II
MLADTLHETLDFAAAKYGDVLSRFPTESASITLTELADSSARVAAALLRHGVQPGDRVGLLCRNEPWFFQGLFALSRIGAAVCPLPLPTNWHDMAGYAGRLRGIAAAADMRHLVVTGRSGRFIDTVAERLPGLTLLRPAELSGAGASSGGLPRVSPGERAVVQYTSGSITAPKGVQLTHANVLAGLDAIVGGIDMGRPDDAGGSWLPLYHDMGLFGTLSAVLVGMPAWVWSPTSFVKNPGRWLRDFAATRSTVCPGPNFGYDHLLAAVSPEEAATLDLSCWRVAFNGAETIAVDSIEAFLERFAPAGFRPEAMFPVYGLAEATLAVTFPPLGRPPVVDWVDSERLASEHRAIPVGRAAHRSRGIVGLGRPVGGMRLRIANPETGAELADQPADQWADCPVGEVQVQGPAVTAGYLGGDPASHPFTADGWLRTGDLGYRRDGELFLTGRIKEMMVVRGANFYPEDVESIARTTPGVYKRRCVAFARESATMVLVAETRLTDPGDRGRLSAELLSQVSSVAGLAEVEVHLLPPGSIPSTSSGKLRRLAAGDVLRSQHT